MNKNKDALYTEKVSGTIHYCLGFVKSRDKKYYIPNPIIFRIWNRSNNI